MLKPASDGGADASNSTRRSRDVSAKPPFLVSDVTRDYGASLEPRRFAEMRMNDNRSSVSDVRLWRNCDIVVDTGKKRWWHCGGQGASVCR